MGRPYKCPKCGSNESVSKGVRKTKLLGIRRLRRCKACGRKFTPKYQKPADDREDRETVASRVAEVSTESTPERQAPELVTGTDPATADPPLDGPHTDH